MKRPFATTLLLLIFTLGMLLPAAAQKSNPAYANIPAKYHQKIAQIGQIFKKKGFDLDSLFSDHRFKIYGSIGQQFIHSAENEIPTLNDYKELLGFKQKITSGVQFLEAHKEQLLKAQKEYGISQYIITAILGIESNYGRNLGSYNPFNVYVSMLVVGYRTDFAREQLEQLLDFTTRENVDVLALRSSYAGAMSYAQFIPSSVNKWWVGDRVFDMNNSILSIANYLEYFKQRTGSISEAILRYNHSHLYRGFVLDLAKAVKQKSGAKRAKQAKAGS